MSLQELHRVIPSLYILDLSLSPQCIELSKPLSVSSFTSMSLLVLLELYSLETLFSLVVKPRYQFKDELVAYLGSQD